MKRRSSATATQANVSSSVKRTKVQAQRKFAQNNYAYSTSKILTKTPEEYKTATPTLQMSSPENEECELNTFSRLPTVDDLLTFLCYRQTDILPARLNYLNNPQFEVQPDSKKCTKTKDNDEQSVSQSPIDCGTTDQSKREASKICKDNKLGEYKKFKSRSLTGKCNSKIARSLALKHNQRIRLKNVVKAKISENKLKNKLVSIPKTSAQSIRNVSNGRATRNSVKRQVDSTLTNVPTNPSTRVTRRNLTLSKLPDIAERVTKKTKLNLSACKKNPLITSELSVQLDCSKIESKSFVLPKYKSNITNCNDPPAVDKEEKVASLAKPITRSTRQSNGPPEETRSTRSHSARSIETARKPSNETPIRATRSGSALLNDAARNPPTNDKEEVVPVLNTRPSRKTKEAATFYMELLGKQLLCSNDDDENDSFSIESSPEAVNSEHYSRRGRVIQKQAGKTKVDKVSSRKTSILKLKPVKSAMSQAKSKPPSRRSSEVLDSAIVNERDIKPSISKKARLTNANNSKALTPKKSTPASEADNKAPVRVSSLIPKKSITVKEASNKAVVPKKSASTIESDGKTTKKSIFESDFDSKTPTVKKSTSTNEFVNKTPIPRKSSSTKEFDNKASISKKSISANESNGKGPTSKELILVNESDCETPTPKKSTSVNELANKAPLSRKSSSANELNEKAPATKKSTLVNESSNKPIPSIPTRSSCVNEVDNKIPISKKLTSAIELDDKTPISTNLSVPKKSMTANEQDNEALKPTSTASDSDSKTPTFKKSMSANEPTNVASVPRRSVSVKVVDYNAVAAKKSILTNEFSNKEEATISKKTISANEVSSPRSVSVKVVDYKALAAKKSMLANESSIKDGMTSKKTTSANETNSKASSTGKSISFKVLVHNASANRKPIPPNESDRKESTCKKSVSTNESDNETSTPRRHDESVSKASVPEKSVCEETQKVDSVRSEETKGAPSPRTIEVTIKDLTKKQQPEKSVFRKKVLSMKSDISTSKNMCKGSDAPIRDLTKTGSVELVKLITGIPALKGKKKIAKSKCSVSNSSIQTDTVTRKRNTSPTIAEINRMGNLADKKIFRKSEVELNRKSEAFSADNEKSVYAFEPDLPTTSPPFRRLKPITPPKAPSVSDRNPPTARPLFKTSDSITPPKMPFTCEADTSTNSPPFTGFGPITPPKMPSIIEPNLPTNNPPFIRLEPIIPPKLPSAANSVAVQVNFGNDMEVECSSTGDTQVSSTTVSGGDRVFYIPIQTSAATSTLGVAVKLGTDGPNQKIFMSATLITNSPAFTTNTVTNVSAKSSTVETICVQSDMMNLSNKIEQSKRASSSTSVSTDSVVENKTLENRTTQKPSAKVQSVKILKLNKNKKVDQGTNVDMMKTKFESTLVNRNKKTEMNSQSTGSSEVVKAKAQPASIKKNKTSSAEPVKQKLESKVDSIIQTTCRETARSKIKPSLVNKRETICVDTVKSKPGSESLSKIKKVETTAEAADGKFESIDSKLRAMKTKKTVGVGSRLDEDEAKLPILGAETKNLNSAAMSGRVDSSIVPKIRQNDDFSDSSLSSSSSSSSSSSVSSSSSSTSSATALPQSTAHNKPSTSAVSSTQSVKIVKVNKTKKAESSGHSSGTDSPIPAASILSSSAEVQTKIDGAENKTKKVEVIKTKSKIKFKARPQESKNTEPPSSELKSEPTKSLTQIPGEILEAPTFRPSKAEFNDPLEYIESIRPVAEKFGLCRIVPPSDFRPECKVADEMRFTAYNQYVHKMLHRWGPNVKELLAIKKFLATQNIQLTQAPWIGGMEVDLPRLYQTVQQCGGLSAVIEKERWQAVADMMRIPKLAQDRITKLDDIYCKYLLPYDILSHEEREKLLDDIEKEWAAHLKKSNDDELFEDVDECVVKGRTMPLSCFYRIARNTMMMCFGSQTDGKSGPSTATIEREFWNHVSTRKKHICVHSGSIDSGTHGYGFSVAKNSAFRKHPWNLKVLTNNSASILRFLGPLMGVTVPILHVGMLYSAFCWYRDPHGLPWIEYLHTGADKIWYGIPDEHSERFREAMLTLAPRYCHDKKIWLSSDTVVIPPPLLNAQGVSLSRVVQQPGQFIIVFPKAFTSSISTGYLVSESVYFAQASWLDSAKQVFTDMRDSCEPSVFSLEQLLICIADDARPNISILIKILPLLNEIKETESNLRAQLKERGVTVFEKLNTGKKRKSKSSFQEEEYYECEICHANLFVSLVVNSHKQSNYCLQHAVSMLQRKSAQVKHCKLLYAYTEDELTELVDKVRSRIEAKSAKK